MKSARRQVNEDFEMKDFDEVRRILEMDIMRNYKIGELSHLNLTT